MGVGSKWGVFQGWPLVGLAAMALTATVVTTLAVVGSDEAGVRALVRVTARISLGLFLLAFAASSLRRLTPSPFTAWLLRNRRYLGVAFALSHFVHLAAIIFIARLWPHPFFEREGGVVTFVGGGLGYVFIAAMAATSFDRAVTWLGARKWKRLHTIGTYYVFIIFIFAQAYLLRAFVEPAYIPVAALLVAALIVRLTGKRRVAHAG